MPEILGVVEDGRHRQRHLLQQAGDVDERQRVAGERRRRGAPAPTWSRRARSPGSSVGPTRRRSAGRPGPPGGRRRGARGTRGSGRERERRQGARSGSCAVLPVEWTQQEIADAPVAGTRRAARGGDDRQAGPSNARRDPDAVGHDALVQRRVLADLHIVPQNRPNETGRWSDGARAPRREPTEATAGPRPRRRRTPATSPGSRPACRCRRTPRRRPRLGRCRDAPGSAPGRRIPTDSAGSSSGRPANASRSATCTPMKCQDGLALPRPHEPRHLAVGLHDDAAVALGLAVRHDRHRHQRAATRVRRRRAPRIEVGQGVAVDDEEATRRRAAAARGAGRPPEPRTGFSHE